MDWLVTSRSWPINENMLRRNGRNERKGFYVSRNTMFRQSVVILMGSMARHLDKDNPKVKIELTNFLGAKRPLPITLSVLTFVCPL